MDTNEEALALHNEWRGKIEITCRCPVKTAKDLTLAYTPGVAEPCMRIVGDPSLSYVYTRRWNTVAVITDGTAVLGLGDIGPEAAMPVMEGKCVLFKSFADVDAIPLCIRSKDVDEIVQTVTLLCGSFGAINLEDIAAPRCFEIERRLKAACDIPIFHDDQHGTAAVTVAALSNALKVVGKKPENIQVAISGAGASAQAVALLLMRFGVKDIALCDSKGTVYAGRPNLDLERAGLARITNLRCIKGGLAEIMEGADVFFGLSAAGLVTGDMIRSMAKDPIVFPMANPIPEIMPDEAFDAGAVIVGTGRSDFANQINNVLAFPGILRGALDTRASDINEDMQLAAALAIAGYIMEDELKPERILPAAFEPGVGEAVAAAVTKAARQSGVARI